MRVIDRSLDDLKSVRRELSRQSKGKDRDDDNWVLISRLAKFKHSAKYEPPSSLFKSEEELASDPGTCTHKGKVEIDIKAFVLPGDDTARSTSTLINRGKF